MKIRLLISTALSAAMFVLATGIAEASPRWLNLVKPNW